MPFSSAFNRHWLATQSNRTTRAVSWGHTATFRPGDYDGDGKADFAIFRPSTGLWLIFKSSTKYSTWISRTWGQTGDVPVAGGDFDGDGKADITFYRPSTGYWYILKSSTDFIGG